MGVLKRLNELNILPKIDVISTVSGGSIIGAYYAHQLGLGKPVSKFELGFKKALKANVRLRALTGSVVFHPIRAARSLLPGYTRTNTTAAEFDRLLFAGATLQDLPDHLKLIINATSLNTGQVWKFSKNTMYDYRFGTVANPKVPLCEAVGASAAVPGLFPPLVLDVKHLQNIAWPMPNASKPFVERVKIKRLKLSDGGVRDNQGIRSLLSEDCAYLIVSDASGLINPDPDPSTFSAKVLLRSNNITMDAARDLIVEKIFERKELEKIRQIVFFDMEDKATDSPGLPSELRSLAANVRTDLDWFSDEEIETIQYHGYTLLDQKARKYGADLLESSQIDLSWQVDYTPDRAEAIKKAMAKSHKRRLRPHKF
jgi:NTE family protein